MTLLQEVFKKLLYVVLAVGMFPAQAVAVDSNQSFSFGKSKVALPNLNLRKKTRKQEVVPPMSAAVSTEVPALQPAPKSMIHFAVKNELGRKVVVAPFAYVKRFLTDTWHWVNLTSLELEQGQQGLVDVGALASQDDAETVFGALRLCATKEEAAAATYELSQDHERVDVGLFSVLNKKTVILRASQYGVEGERISYEVSPSKWTKTLPPLDFAVINTHSEPVFLAAFFYGKEQDSDPFRAWRFTKSPVYELKPGQSTVVKVETIKDPYDWQNIKGYLSVFKQNEKLKAQNATYELLLPSEKIALGPLSQLAGKQVALVSRLYGTETVFDFSTTLPARALAAPQTGTTTAAT